MSHKIDKRLLQTEAAIMEAGTRTLLSNRSAGMAEIAEAAGIGRATLYRHFKTREALIKKLVLDCYEEFDAAYSPYLHLEGRAALQRVFEIAFQMSHRFNFLFRRWSVVEDDQDLQRLDARTQEEMGHLFDQAKSADEIEKSFPNAWLIAFFDSLLVAGCALVDSGEIDAEQAADYAIRSFFNGCGRKDRSGDNWNR